MLHGRRPRRPRQPALPDGIKTLPVPAEQNVRSRWWPPVRCIASLGAQFARVFAPLLGMALCEGTDRPENSADAVTPPCHRCRRTRVLPAPSCRVDSMLCCPWTALLYRRLTQRWRCLVFVSGGQVRQICYGLPKPDNVMIEASYASLHVPIDSGRSCRRQRGGIRQLAGRRASA
eukprot:366399-Chlamydomonas_euryale.AAC.29